MQARKKQRKIELLNKEKELQATELKKNRTILTASLGGLVLVIMFSFLLYNRFRITRKQKRIIELQKNAIQERNKDITDSIEYAKKIQSALLPTNEYIKELLPESFVLFKPRDIVSGDFYWIAV